MDYFAAEVESGQISLLLIGLLTALSVFLALTMEGVVNRFWRAGLDPNRNLGGLLVATKMLFTLAIGALLAARAVQQFALGHVFQSVVTLLLFLLVALSVGRDIVGCWVLTFSTRVRVGDRMQMGDMAGTVRKIGLVQVTLRDASGTKLVIPNREFLQRSVMLAKTKHSVPLQLLVPIPKERRSVDLLQKARVAALLSPFRSLRSAVHADFRDDTLELSLEVWSPLALERAKTHLSSAIAELLHDTDHNP